jgi:hypothetical protein
MYGRPMHGLVPALQDPAAAPLSVGYVGAPVIMLQHVHGSSDVVQHLGRSRHRSYHPRQWGR